MLQSMRNGAARWFIWVVVIIIIITFTLWGISSYFTGGGGMAPIVAKVNGIKITRAEFTAAYNRLRQARPKLFTTPNASTKIKQQLLQNLMMQAILSQAALKQGYSISDEQLNTLIMKIPAFQVDGQFSPAQFSMLLNQAQFTPQQFMQYIRATLLVDQVRNGIVMSAFALSKEAKEFDVLMQQQRDIGYFIIPTSRFLSTVKITPPQIKTFYQQHQAAFSIPEKVSIAYVEVSPETIAADIKPSKAELQQYYNDHLSNYTIPARWHVAHILLHIPKQADTKQITALKAKLIKIRMQAEKGTAFATLAKQHSEDIFTVNKRGEMPWFSAGSLDPVFEQTVGGLKVGQISPPVQTRYGMELIKLLAVQPQKVKTFAQVMPQVKKAYISQQVASVMSKQHEILANLAFENSDSLQPVAKQLRLSIKTTPLIMRGGTKTGITANANVVATAFSDDVLQQGNNSDVITLKDGTLIVLRVRKHRAATVKPLAAVKQQIKQQLILQEAARQAQRFGDRLLPQLITNKQAVILAAKHQLQWITKMKVKRQHQDINPLILQQAFNVPAPAATGKLSTQAIALPNGDYVLIGVSKVYSANNKKLTVAQTQQLQQQLTMMFAKNTYDTYVKMQWQQARIKHYRENMH